VINSITISGKTKSAKNITETRGTLCKRNFNHSKKN